jgi:hypothetical protein
VKDPMAKSVLSRHSASFRSAPGASRLLAGAVITATVLLAIGGCGSGSSGSSTQSAFQDEVRAAMAMIGDFVESHEALKNAQADKRRIHALMASGSSEEEVERVLTQMEAKLDDAHRFGQMVHFDRYTKKAYLTAQKRIEANGLVGEGCHFDREGGWQC